MNIAWTLITIAGIGVSLSAFVIIGALCRAATQADRAFEEWEREHRRHMESIRRLCNWQEPN